MLGGFEVFDVSLPLREFHFPFSFSVFGFLFVLSEECVSEREREREGDRETETERQRERQRERQTDRGREREREGDRQTEGERLFLFNLRGVMNGIVRRVSLCQRSTIHKIFHRPLQWLLSWCRSGGVCEAETRDERGKKPLLEHIFGSTRRSQPIAREHQTPLQTRSFDSKTGEMR
jgi:hypothetical protein